MQRNCDLNIITDGKFYGLKDMVRTGCNDCEGCSACCEGMGSSILLDPLDVYNLTGALNLSFEQLLTGYIELNVVDGVILPNLKMNGETEKCSFLNANGRCSIHNKRPGICRIFPLARVYEDNGFRYVLQVNECIKNNRTKVKVEKWIDTDQTQINQKFINDWHYFIKRLQDQITVGLEESEVKNISMKILQIFYLSPYNSNNDFYEQFYERMSRYS